MYTYEIWCDSEVYVGFTSRPPHVRWSEHIQAAHDKRKKQTKFYKKLRATGITKTCYRRHSTEVAALLDEIHSIKRYGDKALNSTKGGEGNNIKVSILGDEVVITKVSEKVKQARRRWYARKYTKRHKRRRGYR